MEISHFRGYADLGMEDPCFNFQWPMNSFDELNALSVAADHHAFGESANNNTMFNYINPICFESRPNSDFDRPVKQLKTNSWNSCTTDQISNPQSQSSSPTDLLPNYANTSKYANQVNFVKPKEEGTVSSKITNSTADHIVFSNHQVQYVDQNYVLKKSSPGAKRICTSNRLPGHAQDHILAERKRREKLSQRFIALSALLPGLKKMDKASVLGDAIKYVKQLQDRVKALEDQSKARTTESVVFVKKKYEVLTDGEDSNSPDNHQYFSAGAPVHDDEKLPEIEARFTGKDVLIRIHCERKSGVLEKSVGEIEKLNLSVTNTTSLSFGTYALDITIIAQVNKEFNMRTKDLLKNLRSALKQFM